MRERSGAKRRKVRGKQTNTQFVDGLGDVVRETTRLWRKHHLGYDQTKEGSITGNIGRGRSL